ncbi:MAG: T9SS type A sorting domain-containing protein, partial [Christiangramia sp.]
ATYSEAFCKGTNPGTVTGSLLDGNNILYTWELSTEGPASGFAPAPGNNNEHNYDPGVLDKDIWLKRIVYSGSCSSESPVLYIPVKTENTWTGTENTNWNNTNNWSCNSLPTLQTNILIPENLASGNYPEITAGNNALAKNLVIENNASVLVDDNWLRIAGNLNNSGILNSKTGSVSFEGTSAQIIPNSAFENNRILNLRIDNTSGVTSQTIIEITGTLKVETGTFETGNELTLISDETQTALIDGSGNGEISGLVSMQRYLDKAFGYKYFSSPFQNSVVEDFAPYMDFQDQVSDFPHFYRYNENRNIEIDGNIEDATGWESYINPYNTLNVSEGYALNFGTSATPRTIELIGEVNNGNIPAKQLLNHHRQYTRGFHLVGNPYPSPIDWEAAQGWIKDNIDDGIYFFTASDTSQYTGTYTAYVNDISTGEPLVDGRSSNIIPSMQGFFIKVSDSDSRDLVTGDFGMDNRVRVTDFDQQFLRAQLPDQKSLLRLEAGYNGAARKDLMVIYFSSFATPNFEKEMDAHKLMNTDPAVPSFYNLTEDRKELSINAIPFPQTGSYNKIPLGIKADQSGEMKITLNSIENLTSNFNIYLIDHAKGIGQNLSQKPEYRFNINQGIHNSRFELMFSEEKVTNPAIAFDEPFSVETRTGEVIVKLNLEENQEGVLRASTMTGQILHTKRGTGKEEVIFNGITSDGVYIINLQVGKTFYTKKVIIKR